VDVPERAFLEGRKKEILKRAEIIPNKEGKEKDYNVRDEWKKRVSLTKPQPFVPKPEYSRLQFDPNVRHRMPEISNDTLYRMVGNYVPQKDPQSCYVAI